MLSETLMTLIRNPETPDYVIRDAVLEEEPAVANVYLVCGHTGQYSDQYEWTVAGFLDKEHAEAFCDQLNRWCIDHMAHKSNCNEDELARLTGVEWYRDAKCPMDPSFKTDYTGTSYDIDVIPLRADG